jgi:hypothetical protein
LVSPFKREIQNLLYEGASLKWNSYKIEAYVTKITQAIFDLEEKVEELLASDLVIDKLLIQLDICKYDYSVIADIMDRIQKLIDELGLKTFSNLPEWVQRLDNRVIFKNISLNLFQCIIMFLCIFILQIEKVLVVRLEKAFKYWTKLILKSPVELNVISEDDSIYSPKISVNNKNFGDRFSLKKNIFLTRDYRP